AASWVIANDVAAPQIKSLLVAPDGRLFPQTRLATAWLVAIDPDRFGWLVHQDPEAFRNVVDLPGADLRAAVVDGLYAAAAAHRSGREFGSTYKGLNYPGLADHIRPWLRDESAPVRSLAIQLAHDCGLLRSDLRGLALDVSTDVNDRVQAAWAVVDTNKFAPLLDLLPLVTDPELRGEDPMDELLGVGLLASWPHAIVSAGVFPLLTPPKRHNFLGAYAVFLDRFAAGLTAADLDAGLSWLRSAEGSVGSRSAVLGNAVLRLAADQIDRAEAQDFLVEFVKRRAPKYEGLFFEELRDAPSDPFDSPITRRTLVSAILAASPDEHTILSLVEFTGHSIGIVRFDDLGWLADKYATAGPDERVHLRKLFEMTFRLDLPDHRELLFGIDGSHPLFVDLVRGWLAPVDLNSPEAETSRAHWAKFAIRRDPQPAED